MLKAIINESGQTVIALVDLPPVIQDQRHTGNSHGSAQDVHAMRAMAKAVLNEANTEVVSVPRPSTPKEAASVRTDRVQPLKQRRKRLAKKLKRSR